MHYFILCQEDLYLMELVRYIHLNPLRAKLVSNLAELDQYPYGGHSTLMGSKKNPWQDVDYVLSILPRIVQKLREISPLYRVA